MYQRRGLIRRNSHYLVAAVVLLDTSVVFFSAYVSCLTTNFYHTGRLEYGWPQHFQTAALLGAVIAPLLFSNLGMYRDLRGSTLLQEFLRLFSGWSIMAVGLIVLAALLKITADYSRLWFVLWFGSSLFLHFLLRFLIISTLWRIRQTGADIKSVFLIGGGDCASRVVRALHEHPQTGYRIAGYFAARPMSSPDTLSLRYLGPVQEISSTLDASANASDEVWVALSPEESEAHKVAMEQLKNIVIDVRLIPHLYQYRMLNASFVEVAGLPVVNISRSPIVGFNRVLKRLEDVSVASVAMLLCAPVMLLISIAIKLTSRGPILYMQSRHGLSGEEFTVYKFRTLYHSTEDDEQVALVRGRDDPRITPLGKILRRTSLDELPQLLNVLQGNMSIVGPRPYKVTMNDEYRPVVESYVRRHKVKPGITGWAQVNGLRGELLSVDEMTSRIEHDLYYIENWSIWLDMQIIIMTVFSGFSSPRAY